jgi:hypothetical protein
MDLENACIGQVINIDTIQNGHRKYTEQTLNGNQTGLEQTPNGYGMDSKVKNKY